ncbi:MAG: histidine kinase [Ignavibacteriaceae bacterium]|nr:histidine kinase [Ignavibacteriaceae bacterium]
MLLLSEAMGMAAPQKNNTETLFYELLSADNILPSNRIGCFLKDQRGYLWIGTESGLVRYDGLTAEHFNPNSHKEYKSFLPVTDLFFMPGNPNIIIIVLTRQILLFDTFYEKFIELNLDLPSKISETTALYEVFDCKDGKLWFISDKYILQIEIRSESHNMFVAKINFCIDLNERCKYIDKISDKPLSYIVFTETRLINLRIRNEMYDIKTVQKFPLRYGYITSVYKSGPNLYFAGTENTSMIINPAQTQIYSEINNAELKFVTSIIPDTRNPECFVLTRTSLFKSDQFFTHFNEITLQPIMNLQIVGDDLDNIYLDDSNFLWIGTLRSGALKIDLLGQDFNSLNRVFLRNGFNYKIPVWSIIEDDDKSLIIGSNGILYKLSPDEQKVIKLLDLNTGEFPVPCQIRCVISETIQNKKIYWLAVFNYGLIRYEADTGLIQYYFNNRRTDFFYDLKFDENGDLLVACNGSGLLRFNKKTCQFQRIKYNFTDLSQIWITKIIRTLNPGEFLLTSYDKGILQFNTSDNMAVQVGSDSKFSHGNLMIRLTNGLILDNHKIILGSLSGGLLFTDEKFYITETFTRKSGLPDEYIFAMTPDNFGFIWIGTGKGISRFDSENKVFLNFSVHQGLISNDINMNSTCKTTDGFILFGTNYGLISVNPGKIRQAFQRPPKTEIVSFDKGGINLIAGAGKSDKSFILENDEKPLTVRFKGIHFHSGQNISFRYQIKGYTDDWRYSGSKKELDFLSLPAGEYELIVQAANAAGLWDSVGDRVRFTIPKKFWAQPWFIFVMIILTAALIHFIMFLRIKSIVRIERRLLEERIKIRTKLNEDLHDELGHKLTSIKLLSESIIYSPLNQDQNLSNKINFLNSQVSDLFNEIRDFTWVMNPKNDSVDDLTDYIWRVLDRLLSDTDTIFEIDSDLNNHKSICLGINEKNTVVKILKESVINSLKHGGIVRNIKVILRMSENTLNIQISDDGCGFDTTESKPGNGILLNMKRCELIDAVFKINSIQGVGTNVSIMLPIVPDPQVKFSRRFLMTDIKYPGKR